MKKISIFIACLIAQPVFADEQAKFLQQGQHAIQAFSEALKSALLSAMESGGPTEAVAVCKDVAPLIASELSNQYNFNIARTSLKVRNPNNVADVWEKAVLNQFENSKNQGAEIGDLKISELVTQGNQQERRLMKAIPTGQLCLTCHGENIEPTLQTRLQELYPDDEATGFKLGDIRGAFTIRKVIQ